jgi:SAM-dependent methyltransferase
LAAVFRGLALGVGLRAHGGRCPACGPSFFVRYGNDETAVRCIRCRATPITLSLLTVLRELYSSFAHLKAYELSTRGALVKFLRKRVANLTTSEYVEGALPGETREGVLNQDVMRLTFADASFDLCTSTEVFEHVSDDLQGFREIRRVLRPGGRFVFTVPMKCGPTLTRAIQRGSAIEHLLEPEFHSDRLRGRGKVLCFRNYGADIVQRLEAIGFAARIETPARRWFGHVRPVVVAERR